MKTAEFIEKWNVAYEDLEQANEFSKEMYDDLISIEKDKPISDRIFEIANELAVLGHGEIAVRLHELHNNLPPSTNP